MSALLAPVPVAKFWDNNGLPLFKGKLTTYAAGTTTPQATYIDSTQTTPNTNPVILNARGECNLWLDPTLTYKFVLTDVLGSVISTVDNIPGGFSPSAIAASLIPKPTNTWNLGSSSFTWANLYLGASGIPLLDPTTGNILFYARTPAEIAAGVTPVNYSYAPGFEGRQGMVDNGTTDNTAALQALINGAAGSVPVVIRKFGSFYKLTSLVNVPANTHLILEDGAELQWTATTATGPVFQGSSTRPGLLINGGNFLLSGLGKITGPSVNAYTQSESAIMGFGASRTAPIVGFSVDGEIEFSNWGWGAGFIQFFTDVRWCKTYIHNVGYIGVGFASCVNGVVQGNRVDTVTPGTSSNAYGITCTHDSTNYSSDPNAATNGRITANPFCIAFDVAYNTIMNIPIWEGIDAHGGYELHYHHNNIYNCAFGVALAGGSGAAAGYSGEDNEVSFNNIYLNQIDGTASTATPLVGIELKGGTTVLHRKVRCIGNVVDGYGNTTVSSYCIEGSNCLGLVVADNIINNWEGYGFYAAGAEGLVANNTFQGIGVSATNSVCIFLDTTTASITVTGNCHHPISGTAAAIGLRINNTANPRGLVKGNDFSYATLAFGGFADGAHTLGDSYPVPVISVTGSPTSIDVSAAGSAPLIDVSLAVTGSSTVADIAGITVGQILRITQTAAFTTTFDRTHAALPGSANVALTQNNMLQLQVIGTSGTKFIAMSAATTNG